MTAVNLVTLFLVGVISLALAGVAILLITGKGFLFQSGTERLRKTPEDEFALSQKEFIGKSILLVAFSTPLLAFAVIYDAPWLGIAYVGVLLIVFVVDLVFLIRNKQKKDK